MASTQRPISELVAEIRTRENLTQEGLARVLGVSFSTVNAWESGRSQPQPRHRKRLEQLALSVGDGAERRPTVLCVDDSPFDLENLSSLVSDAAEVLGVDLTVLAESDAMRALLTLGRVRPQVTFVDVVMPGLDGFALADRIAEMPELSAGLLVLVTGNRDIEVERQAEHRGLLVLDKPLAIRDVGAILRQAKVHLTPDPII